MRKGVTIRQPQAEEIQEVAGLINSTEFWSCVSFADTTNRYIEITMKKDNVSRLHGITMYCLVLLGGSSTPTQLAKIMFRSKHSMTKIIDSLEKEGLVIRDYTNKDRRVTYIKLTSAGLDYIRQNITEKGNKRAIEAMNCLNEEERLELVGLLSKLRKSMTSIINNI